MRKLILALSLTATPAFSRACAVDMAAVEDALTNWEQSYADVLSDIACDAPTIPAHQLLCASAEDPDDSLWRMARLNTIAFIYAYENATKVEVNRRNPPTDDLFIQARDACTDAACLCDLIITSTNDNLGGLSPYPQ